MNPDSSIFRLASVGSYLDALSSITAEMSLKERSDLIYLDKCLHGIWGLGQNVILCWCPTEQGIALLSIPHYAVPELAGSITVTGEPHQPRPSEDFFKELLSGERLLSPRQLDNVARLLGIEPTAMPLRASLTTRKEHQHIIDKMIRRYGITYVPSRAVVLFDIVGFSLLTPFEQMTQLNSLSYSLNSAHSKLLDKKIGVDFARSTSGDGFYIWNRDLDLDANVNLYHLMHLILADNAIARRKASHNTVPNLRACFHAGSSYEFHQSEGLNPSLSHYIVGNVTVELARMIDRALPNQILVGDFAVDMPLTGGGQKSINSVDFINQAAHNLEKLEGLDLSGERIDAIKCYLTGERQDNGNFSIRPIFVSDKHGISRQVYNAKVNIYRHKADPILLGIEDRHLTSQNTFVERRKPSAVPPLSPEFLKLPGQHALPGTANQ